jgi:glutamyl-Q tRNA(Asp) synthetase
VVRGADLLGSTPWQLGLQKALGIAAPRYLHLPVVVEPDGSKLAKSRRALPVSDLNPRDTLADVLRLLGQPGDRARHEQPMEDHWRAAIAAWDPGAFRGVDTVPAPLLTQ